MDNKNFSKAIFMIKTNFGLEPDAQYLELMFEILKKNNFSEKELEKAISKILQQENLFKMPTVAEWLKFGRDQKKPEEQASIQATLVISQVRDAEFADGIIFPDPVTNAVIKEVYEGFGSLLYELTKEGRRDDQWFLKEFKEHWLNFNDLKKTYNQVLFRGNHKEIIRYIENKEACLELMKTNQIEHKNPESIKKINEITSKLFKVE